MCEGLCGTLKTEDTIPEVKQRACLKNSASEKHEQKDEH